MNMVCVFKTQPCKLGSLGDTILLQPTSLVAVLVLTDVQGLNT